MEVERAEDCDNISEYPRSGGGQWSVQHESGHTAAGGGRGTGRGHAHPPPAQERARGGNPLAATLRLRRPRHRPQHLRALDVCQEGECGPRLSGSICLNCK